MSEHPEWSEHTEWTALVSRLVWTARLEGVAVGMLVGASVTGLLMLGLVRP